MTDQLLAYHGDPAIKSERGLDMTDQLLAYHGDPAIKSDILATLARHRAADELVQNYGYWEDGKGCAVGCTIQSGKHIEYETRFGIPIHLARLEDCIFEGLPVDMARQWPERFMMAIKVGSDLSLVHWKFFHWLLTDVTVNPGIASPIVKDAVKQCADLIAVLAIGGIVTVDAARTARIAAKSASSMAAWQESETSGMWSAVCAENAVGIAEGTVDARITENAARSVSSAARSAEGTWVLISDTLIDLIQEAGEAHRNER